MFKLKKDLTGKNFGRWVIIKRGENRFTPSGGYSVTWVCQCQCGNIKEVPSVYLLGGQSKSCGCYMKEKAASDSTTHGLSDTKEYARWADMHQRCYNENHPRFKDWGGRGIKICGQWHKENPMGFLNYYKAVKDLGHRPYSSSTIDRIDNDKDYSPDNIKWSNKRQQRLNQQNHRVRFLTYKNETLCMKDWGKKFSTSSSNILYFLKKGKTFEWIYEHYMGVK